MGVLRNVVVVVVDGGMRRPPLQFCGEDSQIKLYMNLDLHYDRVNTKIIWCDEYSVLSSQYSVDLSGKLQIIHSRYRTYFNLMEFKFELL